MQADQPWVRSTLALSLSLGLCVSPRFAFAGPPAHSEVSPPDDVQADDAGAEAAPPKEIAGPQPELETEAPEVEETASPSGEAENKQEGQPEPSDPASPRGDPEPSEGGGATAAGSDLDDPLQPVAEVSEPKPVPAPGIVAEQIRVAVGYAPEANGSKAEKALLDELETAALGSADPVTDVRRLRVGSAGGSTVCREGRDDLVVMIGYLPDRADPVVLTHDCRINESLGVRREEAARDAGLIGVLWDEHDARVAAGARERRRLAINPKVRTGLIAGSAVLVIGVALGLLIAGAVSQDSVRLVVEPR